jgi:hypothetical protein
VATPKGLHLSAQGCRTRLPWVTVAHRGRVSYGATPTGSWPPAVTTHLQHVLSCHLARETQPLWGWNPIAIRCPKVAEYGNLGL